MKASAVVLLSLYLIVITARPGFAQNDFWFPGSVQGFVTDCITHPSGLGGPNTDWPEPPPACDDYDSDLLERPFTQLPDNFDKYFSWVDIDTAWFGQDADWVYGGIGIRGLKDGNTIDAKPFLEFDFDQDGRGDVIVLHEGGKNPDDFDGSFGHAKAHEKLTAREDTDNSIGGSDVNMGDGPGAQGDGYDTEVWKTGDSPSDGCKVRQVVRSIGLPRFDFACRKSVIGDPGGSFAFRATVNRGSNDFSNFTLNDTYDEGAYGSPYSANPNYESSNSYEMDNTPWTGTSLDLPVEFGSFDVVHADDELVLAWTTRSETNNSGFAIEHAMGSLEFEYAGFVRGAGTTLTAKSYTYRYPSESPGLHRFRLKQIDFDGAFTYSQTVEVTVDLPERFVLEAAYPNPFNPSTTVRFAVAESEFVSIRLYDALGREVRTLFEGNPAPDEMHRVTVDAVGLPSGNYVVRLEGESYFGTTVITLLK